MLNIYKKIRDTSFYTFHHILYIYDWVIFGEIPVMILWVGDIIQIQKLTNVLSKKKKKKVNKFTSYVKWHSYSVRMKDVPSQIADILLANFG